MQTDAFRRRRTLSTTSNVIIFGSITLCYIISSIIVCSRKYVEPKFRMFVFQYFGPFSTTPTKKKGIMFHMLTFYQYNNAYYESRWRKLRCMMFVGWRGWSIFHVYILCFVHIFFITKVCGDWNLCWSQQILSDIKYYSNYTEVFYISLAVHCVLQILVHSMKNNKIQIFYGEWHKIFFSMDLIQQLQLLSQPHTTRVKNHI